MDLWKLKDELLNLSLSLCDDTNLAEDIVQETFLFSIENRISERQEIFSACREVARRIKRLSRSDPGAALNKYVGGADEKTIENIWRKISEKTETANSLTWEELIEQFRPLATFKGKWLPHIIAKYFIQTMGFERAEDFKSFIRSHKPIPIPRSANVVYAENWNGWDDFLGYKKYSFSEFCTYLRTVLASQGISTFKGFWSINHPKYIPKSPNIFYRGQWKGWPHAFGKEINRSNTYNKSKKFLSYTKARAYVRRHLVPKGIDSLHRWDERISEIPLFLPSGPDTYYKGKGWVNSSKFFGTRKLKVGEYKKVMPYNKARLWVIKHMVPLGIDSSKKWEKWRQGKYKFPRGKRLPQLPKMFPFYPAWNYANRGWRSWRHWFGSSRVSFWERAIGKPWTYDKCKQWIKKNLKGQIKDGVQWIRYIKGEMPGLPELPGNIWRNPWHHFKPLGQWKGWPHFLSVRKRRGKATNNK